ERLIRIEPANATAHAMAGVLAFEAGDCPSAVRHFESSRSEVEANDQASGLYGECLVKLNRAQEAVPFFVGPAAAHPDAAHYRSLAAAQVAAGQAEAAFAAARRAIDATPGSEQNYVELASMFLLREFNQPAAAIVEAGLQRLPRSARLYGLRGVAEA